MTERIIGHGTWYDKFAVEIVEREQKLGRDLNLIRAESGLGASGFPHIGSIGDCVRSYAVVLALRDLGCASEYIAFADDLDGLRKVPASFPKSLEKYLGYSVSFIPDPFGCHQSYGGHMSSLLLDALETCGIKYVFMSGADAYKRGLLNKEIESLLSNSKRIGEIVREEVGQEKYVEALPYFATCSNCNRIYTTKAYEFLPKEKKVLYICEGMKVKSKWLKGCGFKGEADYTKGEGKLSWKSEFAARWRALDIRFEPYGKDIADSVRINDRICREILRYTPPLHVQYEMFLDKSGKKISKSSGNVFTPQLWFRYGSPQSLLLLMLKRFTGTRTISVADIPQYMDEFDELEDIFFGKKTVTNEKERAKLKGLYEYCEFLQPPSESSIHVPYNLLTFLVKVAPEGAKGQFLIEKLREYHYLKEGVPEDLKNRIEYAKNWNQDFKEIRERIIKLSEQEKNALVELIETLRVEADESEIQTAIFRITRKNNIQPRQFFKTLYTLLLGVTGGPKLGPYIVAMGRQAVIDAFERTLRKQARAKKEY